ncbi:hypothetical protein ISN45_At03g034230 [Arabidopsis thaliana x Arabidopsis arenosa]|uniref:Uncharacterized protein n=1 Tax=Arabidopsis thaliana x Arabidopsis arenosa TaxID=1240361 RepID=A0A8T2F6D3_9BRAS|nr:hypothetical protein ISN45_At03g034230 [Arabidopsis thaliana x Arabidopsis arenosa]
MPRQTRSTKQKGLINLSVLDLGKLERTNRKTQRLAMADRVIRADAEGVLRDEDGQAYNEAGQRLDDHGLILPEDANEDQERLNAQLAARDAAGLGVDQHPIGVDQHLREHNADAIGVERHNRGVDRHQHQIPAAIPPATEPRRTLGDFNRPDLFYATRFQAIMEKILHTLPKDASRTSSASLNRYVKRLVDNGISSDEAKLLTRDISAIMLPKAKKEKAQRVDIAEYIRIITPGQTTKKLLDPGSFVLDCSISTSRFSRPLCDLGSSINLMPKSVTERLGMTHYRPTRTTLLFADRSKRIPEGILKDVPIQVGNSVIPADFVVLDYEKEPKDPLILGRAFLAIADARFDVKRRRISLKICDLEMEFGMDGSELTKPISCIASTTDTPPQTAQNPTTEPHTTLPFAQLTNESCRATVSIDTPTPVDRHPRISLTDDSAHSLQPTPPEDLCDKFSSLCSPALSLINSLDYSKTASQDNKPRVPRKLVSPVILACDEKSVDRHTPECRLTHVAAPIRSVYT